MLILQKTISPNSAEIYKAKVQQVIGKPFPDDAMEQLWGAIGAVFKSWNGKRAVSYRRIEGIPDEWGTAVNVQAMVFGNMGDNSATGVAFTRNPATGENKFTENGCPTHREKMLSLESAHPIR